MSTAGDSIQTVLERAYQGTQSDVDLTAFIPVQDMPDDVVLAELIDADGRIRIALGRPVELGRYLDAIPTLVDRPDPLDAAIDVSLRAIARTGRPTPEAVEELVGRYPMLQSEIREAATLSSALVSTDGLQRSLRQTIVRPLPADFGPSMPGEDGQRYELRELIGEGAFGQVYKAVDRQLSEAGHEATVAIKILKSLPGSVADHARRRLVDEATIARRVDHAAVVRVLDRGVSGENEDYIVSEYVDGGDLAEWISQRIADRHDTAPASPREAVRMVARLARGVQAAHSAGLVHCDLKPGNIMLTRDGSPKVGDFGIAARTTESTATASETPPDPESLPVGNLAFISPEQFRQEIGARSVPTDLYALGGILFHLLTGVLPNGDSAAAIARTHGPDGRRTSPRVATHLPTIDRDLDMIVGRALAPSAADRYQTAAELANDLDAWLRREPIRWTSPSPWRVLRLWVTRRPGMASLALLLIVAIAAGLWARQHFATEAHNQRLQAQQEKYDRELTEVQLREEEARMEAVTTMVGRYARQLSSAMQEGARYETEILAATWLMEGVFGPEVLSHEDRMVVWNDRVALYQRMLDEARERGESSLRIAIRESQLGFWLTSSGDYEAAEPVLRANRETWSRMLPRNDPWLVDLAAMYDCTRAHRLLDDETSTEVGLDLVATLLEQHRVRLAEAEADSPIHHLVLRTLGQLYGPDALGRADDLASVEADLTTLME